MSFDISRAACFVLVSVAREMEMLAQIYNSNEMVVKAFGYFFFYQGKCLLQLVMFE